MTDQLSMTNTGSSSSIAMEEAAKYWMWMRRKLIINNDEKFPSTYVRKTDHHDSWEEQAFAEDTAGPFGGFMWPPRSYSCSFCGREFRSAQALGGHMNVHRRDRAKLKQSSTTHIHQNLHELDANPSILLDVHHEEYTSNSTSTTFVVSSSSSPPSRVSVVVPSSTQDHNCSNTTTDDSTELELQEKGSFLCLKLSCSTTTTSDSENILGLTDKNPSNIKAGSVVLLQSSSSSSSTKEEQNEIVKFDSAVSLNLAMLRSTRRPTRSDSISNDDQEVYMGCKRRRSLPRSDKSARGLVDHKCHLFQKLPIISSIEELDLELRLGNQPR